MPDRQRLQVIVEGRLQCVYFRAFTRGAAVNLGLTGWVKNRPDGSVEALIEGEKTAVEKMEQWFYQGSPHSRVDMVHTTEKPPVGDNTTFEIQYY